MKTDEEKSKILEEMINRAIDNSNFSYSQPLVNIVKQKIPKESGFFGTPMKLTRWQKVRKFFGLDPYNIKEV